MNGSPIQPDLMPVLSPGRHRNPRKGACFMEFASYLAGERWSDHPQCTHGGLAHLARMVNDCTSDRARGQLAPMIPSVIGVTSEDPRLDLILALLATSAALPVAFEERQRSLAVGAIVCQSALQRLGGSGPVETEAPLRQAFALAPAAERWARGFIAAYLRRGPHDSSARHSHSVVAGAVDGIACACVDDADERLRRLLAEAIAAARLFTGGDPAARDGLRPAPGGERVPVPVARQA